MQVFPAATHLGARRHAPADTMYVRNTPPVIRAIENKHECPSNPESGHSQAVNHIFEPTADGKAYEDSRCQVEFVIPASCNPTVKTWILRRKWVISAETGFRLLRQQWKANCRGPLVIVVKPSHLAGKEDPNWIALASLFQVQDNGPNGVEPAAMYVATNPIAQGPQGFVW